MGIVFKQDAVNTLILQVEGAASSVMGGLSTVQTATDNIVGLDDWQGNKATSVKDYYEHVHGAIIASLNLLMKDIYDQAMLYQKGYHQIDGDAHAVISEKDVSSLGERLAQMAPVFDSLSGEAEQIVRSVSHLGPISYAGIMGFPEGLKSLADKLDNLCDSIGQHETNHQSKFVAERDLIQKVRTMLSEARSTKLESFAKEALSQSRNYHELVGSFQTLAAIVEGNAEAVKQAEEYFQETYDVLEAEYQERVEKAKKAKFWVSVATAIVSTVVIASTGGAGIVLVTAVGAASGAINAGVGSYFDQQIGSVGFPGSVDWMKVGGAALWGGAVGAATSFVSAQIGGLTSSIKLSNVSTTGFRGVVDRAMVVTAKAGVSGGTNAINGMITRSGDALYDSISSGDSLLDTLGNTFSAMTDLDSIKSDFTGGFTSGLVGQVADGVIDYGDKKLFGSDAAGKQADTNGFIVRKEQMPIGHQAYDVVTKTGKETVKGIAKRFGSTIASEDGTLSDALGSAFDMDSIVFDAVSTAGSETAATVVVDVKTVRNHQKALDNIQKQVDADARKYNERNIGVCEELGISRGEDGKPIFSDAGPDTVVAEVTVEYQTSRNRDGKLTFDAMIDSGQISADEYHYAGGTHVIRTVTQVENGVEVQKVIHYTIDHDDFDVNTGTGTMKLTQTTVHKGIVHSGGRAKAVNAYNRYNLGQVMSDYNDAVNSVRDVKQQTDSSAGIVRGAGKAGSKVRVEQPEETKHSPYADGYSTDFGFLPF